MSFSYTSLLPDFPTNIIIAQNATWYTVTSLQNLLTQLNTVYFPIVDSRSTGYDCITALINTAGPPFSYQPPVRFLSPGAYLSSLDPVINRLLSQLQTALAYKDRLLEKTTIGNTTVSTTSNTPQYLLALHTFYQAKLNLTDYINNYTNYTDRTLFEASYSLSWSLSI